MKIGFIGLGHMGNPMCRNLLKHGHKLKIYDVVPELVKKFAADGCDVATSAADCARGVEAVITMLPSSPHVRSVYLSDYGVLKGAAPGMPLIDSSTIDPLTAREVAMDAKAKGCPMVDAPVSGGVGGAEAGTLTFMVGGEAHDYEAAKPILQAMGKNIVHCGCIGNGQVAKICNNMMLAIEMIATSEGMTLAAKLGMDPKVFAAIVNTSSGRCWSSDTYNPYPGVLDSAPAARGYSGGFGSDLMLKDLTLVTDAAKSARHPVAPSRRSSEITRSIRSDETAARKFLERDPGPVHEARNAAMRHEITYAFITIDNPPANTRTPESLTALEGLLATLNADRRSTRRSSPARARVLLRARISRLLGRQGPRAALLARFGAAFER
jgi:3-hydroxyisobutyrate dehydrogenase